ncbi:MAG TPA: DNA translocase FtsK 4TM domain-containing protein [Longimicrobiaceae bacterium]|nr:DNA translocase FtsK 4TM domain-containing protein [Longimicrobiaceae bacterium]
MIFTLDDRQRRELWGLGLLALALLLALSLFPVQLLGPAGGDIFPSRNVVGPVGGWIYSTAYGALGFGAVALPLVVGIWGLAAFEKLGAAAGLRWSILLAGLAVLVPSFLAVVAREGAAPAGAGSLGVALGGGMVSLANQAGALLVLVTLFAALCVATVGWNPLRSAVGGGRLAWGHARRAAAAVPMPTLRRGAMEEEDGEEGADLDDDRAEYDSEYFDDDPVPGAIRVVTAPRADPDATLPSPARARRAKPAEKEKLSDAGDPDSTDLPASTVLTAPPPRDEAKNRQELDKLGQVLIEKLATFKIEGQIVGMTTGPVVTQFEVEPAPGVKVARIASLDADLALALRAPSVRIVAPIPGKGAVGVEVPNPVPEMVHFREIIEAPQYRSSKAALPLALGKDIAGRPLVADLARMPHLLIAGATGSGKSVCVNTLITSLIFRHTPQTLRFLMVDPKMVELSMYNDLPHLRHPVVTDNADAAAVLKWAVLEMERRYELLSANGVRNVADFNARLDGGSIMRSPEADGEEGDPDRWIYHGGRLPYIVVIIDELADLMMTVQAEVEKPLALLAQKARAIGIHLILATQRPSVNVITGLIKANFPSRIAFRVSSKVDSRTILDQNGADALLGNGDLLLLPPASNEPIRIQGAYLSTEDTERLMDWYREQARLRRQAAAGAAEEEGGEEDILEVVRAHESEGEGLDAGDDPSDRDKLFREAAALCIQHQGGSTSLLQRRLRVGYGRAARIIDQLYLAGVLGPPDGSKPREVLVDFVGLDQLCPDD